MKYYPYLAALLMLCATALAKEIKVSSPDGNVVVAITDTGGLSYSVFFAGHVVVDKSRFGIIADGVDLGANVTLKKSLSHTIRQSYPTLGGHARAFNHCRETTFSVHTSAGTTYALDVRAYNDGVALRSRLPAKADRKITGEATEWKVAGNPMAWYQTDFGSYEGAFHGTRLDDLSAGKNIPLPITFSLPGSGYALVTEANLLDYSDLGVQVATDHSLQAYFHAGQKGWTTDDAVVQPWRVTLLAGNLNTLVNSDLIGNLCPEASSEFANADWIQAGRCSWQWWSSGGPAYSEQHQWVDWTKQLGFEYYLIDEGWKGWNSDGKDDWACLREVCDYAKTCGVKIWVWVNSNEVSTPARLTNFMDHAVQAGVVGVKIDFEPPADVQWVNWYDDACRIAASRKLMLDFHGANKLTGREHTWPNELERESIRGNEYQIRRYHRTQPPQHDCILPFTRFVTGPADYTPTIFNPKELGEFTWAHELAQAIVFTEPFLCYCDNPTNYLDNPAVDVLKAIPTTWDETVVLPGSEIGKCAAFARRNGKTWFVGVLNGPDTTSLDLPLKFLTRGKYRMIQLGDVANRNDAWQRDEKSVTRSNHIPLSLRRGGGCVVELKPQNQDQPSFK